MRLKAPSFWNPFRSPRYLGPDFLANDLSTVLAKYREEGYPLARIEDALVTYERSNRVRIMIRVAEGPEIRLRDVRLRGVDDAAAERIRDLITLAAGQPLAAGALDRSLARIEEDYANRGQLLLRVVREVHFSARDSADLVLRLDPGPFVGVDSIAVLGIETTHRETVLNELTVSEGELLTARRIEQSRQRLLELGIFRFVDVAPVFLDSDTPGRATLRIRVGERKGSWIGAGAGFNSNQNVRLSAEKGWRNLQGRGRRLLVAAKLDQSLNRDFRGGGIRFKEGEARVGYVSPHVLGTRNRGILSNYVNWLRESTFDKRTLGGAATLRREINRTTRLQFSLEDREVWSTEPDVERRYATRLLATQWNDDRRDNPFDPTRGLFVEGRADYAGGFLSSSNEFVRAQAVWQGYRRLPERWVLAGRLRVGTIEPVGRGGAGVDSLFEGIPFEERFHVGGSNSIRGYEDNDVGPHQTEETASGEQIIATGGLSVVLVNLEARFPLVWLLSGGVFLDAGNTWSDPREFKLRRFRDGLRSNEYNPRNVHYGMGAGLRFVTPVGPLRLDYAVKVGTGRRPGTAFDNFYIALGQAF